MRKKMFIFNYIEVSGWSFFYIWDDDDDNNNNNNNNDDDDVKNMI